MSKHIKSGHSATAAERFNFRHLLRAAVAASVVAGLGAAASAQSSNQPDLALPAFPTSTSTFALPVSQDASFLPPTTTTKVSRSASARAASLLGLKKTNQATPVAQANKFVAAPSLSNTALPNTTLSLPAFPSTAPQSCESTKLTSNAPSVCCSSGGRSTTTRSEPVVLASAQETSTTLTFSDSDSSAESDSQPSLVPPALASEGPAEEESLIDIEIPQATPEATPAQRLPQLVKRPPAMQLHIGGAPSRSMPEPSLDRASESTKFTALQSSNFTLSDSSETGSNDTVSFAGRQIKAATKPAVNEASSNTMNVRIEGEPGTAKAIARSSSPVAPQSAAQVSLQATSQASAPAKSNAPAVAAPSLAESSSRTATHKSVSDKQVERPVESSSPADHAPTVGDRLEVGLHEATNVETLQPISGLSIEHPELCQVLKSGEHMISLVGLKPGKTRVALFTTDASGERKIEIRDVVIAGTESRQADMKSMATEISQSVHNMFPNSRIEVIAEAEGLTVQGYASTEDEAKKIISLVRRTSLQPVVDRLATYK